MTSSPTNETVLDTAGLDWIPLETGQAFKPISMPDEGPRQLLLRVQPRRIADDEPVRASVSAVPHPRIAATLSPHWAMAVGDGPCVVHISIDGPMVTLDPEGDVTSSTGTPELRRIYLEWCAASGVTPAPMLVGVR